MTDDERIDLSPLDPDAHSGAEDRFVHAVMERVANRALPDRLPIDPLIGVWSLMRSPALAAGILIAVAIGAMGLRVRAEASRAPMTVAQAIGVPADFLPPSEGGR